MLSIWGCSDIFLCSDSKLVQFPLDTLLVAGALAKLPQGSSLSVVADACDDVDAEAEGGLLVINPPRRSKLDDDDDDPLALELDPITLARAGSVGLCIGVRLAAPGGGPIFTPPGGGGSPPRPAPAFGRLLAVLLASPSFLGILILMVWPSLKAKSRFNLVGAAASLLKVSSFLSHLK